MSRHTPGEQTGRPAPNDTATQLDPTLTDQTSTDRTSTGQTSTGPTPGDPQLTDPGMLSPRADRLLSLGETLAVGTVVVAFIVGMVGAVAQGWTPVSDDALIELLVRDVPSNLPLTGVYSRYGWSHPGPALFYLLALPYRLSGGASSALVVGAMVGQLLAVLGAWWVARRMERLAGMLVLCGVAAVLATTEAEVLRSPWNPYVALIGSGLLVVLGWSAASRARAGLIALVPVGSLLVQSHVVTAPMVVSICAAAAIVAVVPAAGRRRPGWDPARRRAAAIGAALTFVMWLPPLVQQVTGDPGNLTELLARRGTGDPIGISSALASMSNAFAAVPSVLEPSTVDNNFMSTGWALPIWLVVPVAGAIVAFRRRDTLHLRGLAVAGAGLLGGTFGIASISDGLFAYLVVWNRSVVVVTLAIGLSALLAAGGPSIRRIGFVAAVTVTVVANVLTGVGQLGGDNPNQSYAPTVEALTGWVDDEDLQGTVAVDAVPDFRSIEVARAVLLQLERRGYEVTSENESGAYIGRHRAGRTAQQLVVIAPVDLADMLTEDGWSVLGVYQPLTDDELERSTALRTEREQLPAPSNDRERIAVFSRSAEIDEELEQIEAGRVPLLVATRPA